MVRGRFYSEEEHKVGLQNMRERFPLLKKCNIIGVVRSKSKKCETIISMVSFFCESDMHRVVAYGEERLDEGVWLRIERPTRAVLNKYAKKIAKNHFF
ncbi:hypothetical protein CASFOL_011579 [Castilleja foliolosa]|uniref:Uncharacterized protein n=1 Tax=Castilleja foliolosa TaxID=1961234 RepID=A0ABD3DZS6_9LAMI